MTRCLLTAQEVADRFRRTPRTLWNWERDGVLIPVRVRGRKLYRLVDVDRLAGGDDISRTSRLAANCDGGS